MISLYCISDCDKSGQNVFQNLAKKFFDHLHEFDNCSCIPISLEPITDTITNEKNVQKCYNISDHYCMTLIQIENIIAPLAPEILKPCVVKRLIHTLNFRKKNIFVVQNYQQTAMLI